MRKSIHITIFIGITLQNCETCREPVSEIIYEFHVVNSTLTDIFYRVSYRHVIIVRDSLLVCSHLNG